MATSTSIHTTSLVDALAELPADVVAAVCAPSHQSEVTGADVVEVAELLGIDFTAAPFSAKGVHEHDGFLWLVGSGGGEPQLAMITADGVGAVSRWDSAAVLAERLAAGLPVLDERTAPVVRTEWPSARSALGELPFVSAEDPVEDAGGVAGFLVAGPSYQTAGVTVSQVAYVPVGLSYP